MTGGRRPRIAVNARFATVPATGVQRYAHELVRRLVTVDAIDAVAIVPPDRVVALDDPDALADEPRSTRWSGGRGHAWEQAVLPALVRRAGADLLVGLCNWGPLALRRQLPLIHDAAPLFRPEYFEPNYVRLTRAVLPRLVRRAHRSAVTCERVRRELIDYAGADADRIDLVPPGVGPPFTDLPVDLAAPRSARCVFIGGHDARKNLAFVRSFWPTVHDDLGLELHVVTRGRVSARPLDQVMSGDGIVVHVDLDDDALARLYADCRFLLWPSRYEGYGLPLLEAMAVGTPFLSTDTGAARELAIGPEQVLPLDADAWVEQLRRWHADDPIELRCLSMQRARRATWARSTERLVAAIERTVAA